LYSNTTGAYNTAVGKDSLYTNSTGTYNAAFGKDALAVNTTGSYNSAFGGLALDANTTGNDNTAIGYESLTSNTTGYGNTAVGRKSLKANTTGISNVAFGFNLHANTTGSYNSAVGFRALYNNTTGASNNASGYESLYSNTTGSSNTAIGRQAGYYITTGSNNTILGRYNGNQGGLDISTSNNNIVLSDGDGNPRVRVDGAGNMGLGVTPESWDATGNQKNLQINASSFYAEGDSGNAIQHNSYVATSGIEKYIVNGYASKHVQQTGTHAFRVAPSGTAGNAIPWTTSMYITNTNRILVGDPSIIHNSAQMNVHAINGSMCLALQRTTDFYPAYFLHNGVQVGYIYSTASGTSFSTSSDYRLKENVVPMSGSIDRLKALKPSRFNFIADADKTVDGFLAHEAQAVVPECVTGEKDAMKMEEYEVTPAVMDGETVITEAVMGERSVPDMQAIDQSKLVPLLVGAIQELAARLEALENS
jgi:hypothetical protein